jgi:hypothetical protein
MATKEKEEAVAKPTKIEQNGVSRPNAGTKTARVWEIADSLSKSTGKPAARKDVLEAAEKEKINASTAATQYGQWRRFNGLGKEAPVAEKAKPAAKEKPAAKVAEPEMDEDEDEDAE